MSQNIAYSIKYIDQGIVETPGHITVGTGGTTYWTNIGPHSSSSYFERIGRGVFLDRETAEVALRVKIAKKIASHKKAIKKLEGLLAK